MMIRTFIAIELPAEVKRLVRQIQEKLGESTEGIRWVKDENLHLSVKFLGNVEENKINDISTAIENAAKDFSVIKLDTGQPGVFPNEKRPRVLWLGIEGDVEQFVRLSKTCESELSKLDYEKDEREIKPHITIGRIRDPKKQKGLVTVLRDLSVESIKFKADSLNLMRSELNQKGAVYSILHSVDLEK